MLQQKMVGFGWEKGRAEVHALLWRKRNLRAADCSSLKYAYTDDVTRAERQSISRIGLLCVLNSTIVGNASVRQIVAEKNTSKRGCSETMPFSSESCICFEDACSLKGAPKRTAFDVDNLAMVKPKFHYANFATKFGTSSRQSRRLVADTNQESATQITSPTFMICVDDFSLGEVSVKVGVMEFGLYWWKACKCLKCRNFV